MIVVLKPNASAERCDMLINWLKKQGLDVHVSQSKFQMVLGLIGDTLSVDMDMLSGLDIIESITRLTYPFKAVGRQFHPADSVITLGENGALIGGGSFAVIAGPWCVESSAQMEEIGKHVKASGAAALFGNAFLPRTSPYDYRGLGEEGLHILSDVKKTLGMPIVSEIKDIRTLPLYEDVDVIQVGPRSAQNYDLLQELGKIRKPVILKRGISGTIKELLMSAEYIIANGNENIILCERGIRTFDYTYTNDTLDISAVPVLRELTHLPIIVEPGHAVGRASLIEPMALAAAAAGADGLLLEVHNDPANALSGRNRMLSPDRFDSLMEKILKIREVL